MQFTIQPTLKVEKHVLQTDRPPHFLKFTHRASLLSLIISRSIGEISRDAFASPGDRVTGEFQKQTVFCRRLFVLFTVLAMPRSVFCQVGTVLHLSGQKLIKRGKNWDRPLNLTAIVLLLVWVHSQFAAEGPTKMRLEGFQLINIPNDIQAFNTLSTWRIQQKK